jgi:hypothetical protein
MIIIDAPRPRQPTTPDGRPWCPTDDDGMEIMAAIERADRYEEGISKVLDAIDRPGVGRIVLESLPANKKITISPKIDPKIITQAAPIQEKKGYAKGTHIVRGRSMLRPENKQAIVVGPGELRDFDGDGEHGNGSDVLIPFDLGQSVPACSEGPANKPRIGDDDDMILVHELVHSRREMNGDLDPIPFNLTPYQLYLDVEEFYAILVQNIYISERCGAGARLIMDHEQGKALNDVKHMILDDFHVNTFDWATSDGFLKGNKDNLKWVARFCEMEEPDLTHRIEQVNVFFNPIREYRMKKSLYNKR